MKSILLIIPYFGKWPLWFDAYLTSIQYNPSINLLCPTDCKIPEEHPKNIKFLKTDLESLNSHVNEVVDCEVPLSPRKFCDLKPAYAEIFSEEVEGYDFWGFCDMDIIWGDIRKFITPELLENYDIISSRKEAISGHFNLFRNSEKLNKLYREIPNYKKLFEHPKFQWTDEKILTECLKNKSFNKVQDIKIYWDTILCNQERGIDSHQEYHLDKWRWDKGKLVDNFSNKEVMYLHFINWKRMMKYSEIAYKDDPEKFYISFNGMHYKRYSLFKKLQRTFINILNGYYVKERRRKRKLWFKKIFKKIKRKL